MKKTKKILFSSISLLILAPVVASAAGVSGFQIYNPGGLPSGGILEIITSIMQWLLTAIGILAIVGFLISGVMYLVSAGDEGLIERAKRVMINSIIGIVVSLLGVVVITAVQKIFSGSSTF